MSNPPAASGHPQVPEDVLFQPEDPDAVASLFIKIHAAKDLIPKAKNEFESVFL
jgi:hypothetical protein